MLKLAFLWFYCVSLISILTCHWASFYFNFFKVLFIYFWCGPFFKVFIEFVTILLLFYVLVFWPWGMWDLSSPTRDWTHTPFTGKWSLNDWIAMEVPGLPFKWFTYLYPLPVFLLRFPVFFLFICNCFLYMPYINSLAGFKHWKYFLWSVNCQFCLWRPCEQKFSILMYINPFLKNVLCF